MTRSALRLLIAFVILTPCSAVVAQTGHEGGGITLTSRVECGYLDRYSGSRATEQHWLVALVLWRGQAGWHQRQQPRAEASDARRAYRAALRTAEDAGRGFVGGQSGGIVYAAAYDSDSLYVLDHSYPLPSGDSALVVMVDRVDSVGGNPAVVGTANIEARLAPEFRTKQWVSGDTLFIIRPRETERTRIFLEALRRAPGPRQFLE
jgi:hypothetical protein